MKRATAIAVLLCAVTANAQTPAAPEPPITGGFLAVGIVDSSQLTQPPSTNFNNNSSFDVLLPALVPTIRVGALLTSQHEVSIGLSFAFANANSSNQNVAAYDLIIAPTYAYRFKPAQPWALSPFVQVQIVLGYTNQLENFSGSSDHNTAQLGAGAAVGGEYLFGDRLGFIVMGGVRLVVFGINGMVFGSNVTTEAGFQVWGSAAVALHF